MKIKVYLDRGRVYASIISFSGTIFLVISQLKILGLDIDLTTYTIPLLLLGFLGIIFIGYIDVKLKLFSEELNIKSYKNPVTIKNFKRFDDLEKKLDKILNK